MAACKIRDYNVAPTESFFFDTNVWIFLFAPLAGAKQHKQKAYSRLLADIIGRNATIWINSLVISEYVNAVLRLAFRQWMRANGYVSADYKHDFRPTAEYQTALTDVRAQVADIFKICQRRPDDFNHIDIDAIVSSMGTYAYDFGDAMIADVCRRNGEIRLVTDDKDIADADLPITVITA